MMCIPYRSYGAFIITPMHIYRLHFCTHKGTFATYYVMFHYRIKVRKHGHKLSYTYKLVVWALRKHWQGDSLNTCPAPGATRRMKILSQKVEGHNFRFIHFMNFQSRAIKKGNIYSWAKQNCWTVLWILSSEAVHKNNTLSISLNLVSDDLHHSVEEFLRICIIDNILGETLKAVEWFENNLKKS